MKAFEQRTSRRFEHNDLVISTSGVLVVLVDVE